MNRSTAQNLGQSLDQPYIDTRRRLVRLLLGFVLPAVMLLGNVSSVSASRPANVLGTWTIDPKSQAGCCSTVFTSENLSTGAVAGSADGGVFKVAGHVSGHSITFTTSEGSYVAHDKATINAAVTKMTGTFTDTNGNKSSFILDHKNTVTLSGTLWITDCSDNSCSRTGAAGELIKVAGTSKSGKKVTSSATSGLTGAWSDMVPAGHYVITPAEGFVPASKSITAKADVSGIDFASCGTGPGTSNIHPVQRDTASGQTGCPDGINWQMEARASSLDFGNESGHGPFGILDQHNTYAPFTVNLNLTVQGSPVNHCASTSIWKWQVAGQPAGAKVIVKPAPGCNTTMQVSRQGKYKIVAKRFVKSKLRQTLTNTIDIQDLLVVGMGDSNGSGEGDPPFYFNQCNRGLASYQYQAADLLERQSERHSSVTFLSAACSGALIQNLSSQSYVGINPGPALPPQIRQIQDALRAPSGEPQRRVDAVIISAGVNNLAFGPILKYCADRYVASRHGGVPCEDSTVRTTNDAGHVTQFTYDKKSKRTLDSIITGLVHQLPSSYHALAASLSAAHFVAAKNVYITQYPSFFYGSNGNFCTQFGSGISGMPQSTWQWLATEASRLNNAVSSAAAGHGWTPVTVPRQLFYGHGYCSSDSWFVPLSRALRHNINGAFHPTVRGAHVTGVLTLEKLCPLLADAKVCSKLPTP